MVVAIRRFLTQVKRHNSSRYEKIPEDFLCRYRQKPQKLLKGLDKASRARLRQDVAQDLHWLIESFADEENIRGRDTYKILVRIFEEQCVVSDGVVSVMKQPGGNKLQNPSDPGATHDGHKGTGYQVQITETCSEENEVQLITSAKLETAAASDSAALVPVLEELERQDLLPDEILADTGYGSDENVQKAAEKGVDLQSPVREGGRGKTREKLEKKDVYSLCIDDFVTDPSTEKILRCPAGFEPVSSSPTKDGEVVRTVTFMPVDACGQCPFFSECPIQRVKGSFRLIHTSRQRRREERRREQATEAFESNYCCRSGIEATNGSVKRRMGLGKLRVRGFASVSHAVYLRIAGWNILRAAAASAFMRTISLVAREFAGLVAFAVLLLVDLVVSNDLPVSCSKIPRIRATPLAGGRTRWRLLDVSTACDGYF